MFGCNVDHLFSEKFTVKDYISNTKLEQGDHYYIQTRYKEALMRTMCSREIFTKKCRQQQIFDSDLKGARHYSDRQKFYVIL